MQDPHSPHTDDRDANEMSSEQSYSATEIVAAFIQNRQRV
jgi:hypothetical protein